MMLAVGNAFDGIRLIGPFEDSESAATYAEDHFESQDWCLVECEAPDYGE